ncbi:hypothetical protein [Allokutzneria albata]|uniref:DUF4390 domain-containing protein n=1 Tax=Allokutzneria albata TaxID=211114 RepID=A0A1G9RZ90_ALLAB|nr:hypothetical protein [Allokutzneria albata]SDM28543.1 hypothetical protein SAMN04489726_0791 [Allokutzneria albata]
MRATALAVLMATALTPAPSAPDLSCAPTEPHYYSSDQRSRLALRLCVRVDEARVLRATSSLAIEYRDDSGWHFEQPARVAFMSAQVDGQTSVVERSTGHRWAFSWNHVVTEPRAGFVDVESTASGVPLRPRESYTVRWDIVHKIGGYWREREAPAHSYQVWIPRYGEEGPSITVVTS